MLLSFVYVVRVLGGRVLHSLRRKIRRTEPQLVLRCVDLVKDAGGANQRTLPQDATTRGAGGLETNAP